MRHQLIDTPIGTLQLVCEKGALIEINWENKHRAVAEAAQEDGELLALAAAEVTHFLKTQLYESGIIRSRPHPRQCQHP